MTTTDEIVVSGEDFIERRIVFPEQEYLASLRTLSFQKRLQAWMVGRIRDWCGSGFRCRILCLVGYTVAGRVGALNRSWFGH